MADAQFKYVVDVDGKKMVLICQVDYDYCTETGGSACLTNASFFGWNIKGILDSWIIQDIEATAVEHCYEIEQRLTHKSMMELGETDENTL